MDLPKILLTGLVFLVFWFSSSFWTIGLGRAKNKKIHGLTQDSSHRIGCYVFFFGFSLSFWTIGLGRAKNLEKNQKKQFCMHLPKILPTGLFFLFFFVFPEFLDIWKAGNGKKGKKQNVKNPTLPAWVSAERNLL